MIKCSYVIIIFKKCNLTTVLIEQIVQSDDEIFDSSML